MTGLSKTVGERIAQALEQGYLPHEPIIFRGITNSTDKTELFINGIEGQRLLMPPNCVGRLSKSCIGYNKTDGAASTGNGEQGGATFSSFKNATTGVITKTATQDGTHVVADIEAGASDQDQIFSVFVTAGDADENLWEVYVNIQCQTVSEAEAPTGIFDDIQK